VPAWLFFIEDWSLVRAADEDELVITASDRTTWLDRQILTRPQRLVATGPFSHRT